MYLKWSFVSFVVALLSTSGCKLKNRVDEIQGPVNPPSVSGVEPVVTGVSVSSGRLVVTGSELGAVNEVSLSGAPNYSFTIVHQTATELELEPKANNAVDLSLVMGTLYSFLVKNADASTTVNVTLSPPAGTVWSFNLAACPTGWSEMDGTGGRPDVRGRSIIGVGAGSGLSARALADIGGTEMVTLSVAQMPGHTHACTAGISAFSTAGSASTPTASYLAGITNGYNGTSNTTLLGASCSTSPTGLGNPHSVMNPFLALRYCEKD